MLVLNPTTLLVALCPFTIWHYLALAYVTCTHVLFDMDMNLNAWHFLRKCLYMINRGIDAQVGAWFHSDKYWPIKIIQEIIIRLRQSYANMI